MANEDWIRKAQTLAIQFDGNAAKHDREGTFPFENFEALKEQGFLSLTVPKIYGGHEISLLTYVRILEILATGDGATALGLTMHLKIFGSEREAKSYPEKWFEKISLKATNEGSLVNTAATEEGLGSPAGGGLPNTVAISTPQGWRISGKKTFTTMAPLLSYFIVLARIDEENDSYLANFLLTREDKGLIMEETWNSLGMRASGSNDIVLQDVLIPRERLLSKRRPGELDKRSGSGSAWFALGVAATTLGVAQAARNYAVEFARASTPNDQKTIKQFSGIRNRIARIDLLLHRSRTLINDAAESWEHRDQAREKEMMQPINKVAITKIDTVNNCIEAVDLAMRVVGGVSLQKSRPIERYYRDVRAGLHNPPIEDRALEQLARSVLDV